MSTVLKKRSLSDALADAQAFRSLFQPSCYARWEIAGSIRREKPEIGDVEHLVIPAIGDVQGAGLFTETGNLLWRRVDQLVSEGVITKHDYGKGKLRWGDVYRGMDFRGICHEIWTANVDNWGYQLVIRTGPHTFSQMMVTRIREYGCCGGLGSLHTMNTWRCECGWEGANPKWRKAETKPNFYKYIHAELHAPVCPQCERLNSPTPEIISCPSEEVFFRHAGMQYLAPKARTEVQR